MKKFDIMYCFNTIRRLCSSGPPRRVCIIGAGPAGFYAAMHLVKHLNPVQIDIIEKLPVPFGLVRYGVAPDHPEVKNCINQFTKLARQENINFYGNITLGKDITLENLRQFYDAVLLTYGAEEDRTLNIDNENVKNIIAARNFVGWYNGHPRDKDLKVDLSGHTAAIIGQGNVALDVARIILTPVDQLKKTDITEFALQAIAESQIKELYLIGRRGPIQVAFTIKELREQLKLPNCSTVWRESDFAGVADLVPSLPRPRKRLTELMLKSVTEQRVQVNNPNQNYFKPIFFRSPKRFFVNKDSVSGIELTCNKLIGDVMESQQCVATEDSEILHCSLALRSIGYKSIKADDGLRFGSSGCVINKNGRVVDDGNTDLGKLYVAGWLGTGPVGVIIHTMGNAFQVAKNICQDLQTCSSTKAGFEGIKNLLRETNTPVITWQGWERIDNYEVDQGKKTGKPREKLTCIKKMLEIASHTTWQHRVLFYRVLLTTRGYIFVNCEKAFTMADENWNEESMETGGVAIDNMPLPQAADIPEIKLFGRWSCYDVQVSDMSLQDYISVKEKYAKYLPHSAGRYAHKRFRKAQCPIVERLTNSLMMHGRNNGKKLMAVRIVKHAFEIIHLLTGENPLQVLVTAIINSGPREDSTRIGRAGTVRRQAVDVSPLRRVNQAIWLLCTGAREAAFRNIKTIAECVADELINAAKGSSNSYAIKKKDELERVAKSNR
ncbi:unnamed protein product [Leptosia nina]